MRADDFVGKQIDDYLVQERIGRGAMATVYRAYQPSVNRYVALKVIMLEDPNEIDDTFRLRFAQEAEVVGRLEHPHVLPVYDYGLTDDVAYITMRWLRGGTLQDILNRSGKLDFVRAADIFQQVARGLSYAHRKGVIHRDIKPSNILLDEGSNAYLSDFGLAKLAGSSMDLTRSGNIVGTPTYMAPEILRGNEYDHRADIYSMGVVLYHMLVGRPPFGGPEANIISVMYQHLEEQPPRPTELNPDIPQEAEDVIMQALEKSAVNRYSSVDAMSDDLQFSLGLRGSRSLPVMTVETNTIPKTPFSTPERRNQTIIGGVIVAALVILLVGASVLLLPRFVEPDLSTEFTVVEGAEGDISAVEPTDAEVHRAAQALGEGFIAYIACNQTSEYHATQAREMVDLASGYGLRLRVYDGQTDPYLQSTLFERARAEGASALIVCPLNLGLLEEVINAAREAEMPIVFMHTDEMGEGIVMLEGDNYLLGLEPGRFAGELVRDEFGGEADVLVLSYEDLPSIAERADGLIDGLLEIAPDANIIGRYEGATREVGEITVADLLDDGVTFDMILSINDAGSYGAITALEEAGVDPEEVSIVSVDAELLARQYIRDSYYMRGSVETGRTELAQAAVNAVTKLLAGGEVPQLISVPPGEVVTQATLLGNDDADEAEATEEPEA